MESLTHLLRGNIGSGLMAMGDAYKNGGLLLAPVLTLFLGIVCVHCQHVLVSTFLVYKYKTSLIQFRRATTHIKSAYFVINPNKSFEIHPIH